MIEIVERAVGHGERRALITPRGEFTYPDLLDGSARVAAALLDGQEDLEEQRVAFLTTEGISYVVAQWGAWRAGGIAVPLAPRHPVAELERVVRDCEPTVVLCDEPLQDRAREVGDLCGVAVASVDEALSHSGTSLPDVDSGRRAMIVYTSGTTGEPKGAVATHSSIRAQITSLVEAWGWTSSDNAMLVLPLYHVHGAINVLGCALWAGAAVDVRTPFDAARVWSRITEGETTVFMAVPTIYRRLIDAWDELDETTQRLASDACHGMRLFVSGSAALPVGVLERWREITGKTLLERYGTTETGMVLSNPLRGERRPGHVGVELPGVEVQLDGREGEILVRGEGVFKEYWNRPEETAAAFEDGWYKTGDLAVLDDGYYRIVGRGSVDIIKTGGHKVSALEIEEMLREHPAIAECAVVGVPDEEWGERVCAAIEGVGEVEVTVDEIRVWAEDRMAPYKIPRSLMRVPDLPRNQMGKVVKQDVRKLFDEHAP